jgi:VCBS repeat-containing protein
VTVNILGTNDAAVLTPAVANLTETNSSADISTSGTLSISDVDNPATFVTQSGTEGTYGTFSIDANGAWTYTADSAHNEFIAGQTYTDTFTVTAADGTQTTVTVNILGTNDAAVLTPAVANLTETNSSADISTSGTLPISDVDNPETFVAQSGTEGAYGTFSIDANGAWTYTADSAHNEFIAGQTYTDTFTVTAADGTQTTVTVNILGTNDVAVIGGVSTGSVTEDETVGEGQLFTDGQLTIADPDAGQATFVAQASIAGTYGTFTLDANGNWTYTADNSQEAIQQLGSEGTLTDSFTAVSADGTASQVVTVIINGTNDGAEIGGVSTGSVTEDVTIGEGQLYTNGQLTIADPDAGQSAFVAQASVAGTYGTFTLDAAGNWTYTANNSQEAIQQLGSEGTLTDSFTAVSADGTDSQIVTVTINGTNDGAEIGGVSTSSVTEDVTIGEGQLYTNGQLTIADPDSGQAAFVAQASIAGTYGTFTLDAAGNWTYTADNSHEAIQTLGAEGTLTDSFTAVSADGTASQVVTVTIHGTNDGAEIGGVSTGSVTEDVTIGEGQLYTNGQLTIADPDSSQSAFVAQASVAGTYGTFTLDAAGNWTYTADNSQEAIQALGAEGTLTDSFTAVSADGTASQVVTVTINGTNDGAEIGGVSTGSVTEDVAVNNAGDLTAQGSLTIADPDAGQASFVAQASIAGTYGTFTLDAAGNWTYTADNSQEAIQALGSEGTLTDSFTAYSTDGTDSQVVTVTIHGTDDGPVGAPDTLEATEDTTAYYSASALLGNDSSSSGGELSIGELINGSGGTVSFSEGGSIAFTPDANFSGVATFYYTVSDGTSTSEPIAVTVNVEAVADTPTLSVGNYGFELGDASGWTVNGVVNVSQSFVYTDNYYPDSNPPTQPTPTTVTILPLEGSYLTVLNTDGATQASMETFLGLDQGELDQWAQQDSQAPGYNNSLSGNATSGSAAVIQIEVVAGQTVSFDWNFIASDYMPYNDYAIVTINGEIYGELSDVLALQNEQGDVTSTGWQTFTYTATESGTLTIGIADIDVGDQVVDSHLLIDNVRVGVSGDAGEPIALDIAANLVDTDGSETLSILLQGLPEGATPSAGTYNADLGGWVLSQAQLDGLTVTSSTAGVFTLTVTATATETSNLDTASSTSTVTLTVYGESNFAQSFSSDMSLMVADTTEAPEQTLFAASSAPEAKVSTTSLIQRGSDWRSGGDIATMQAIAAAAGLVAVAPHFAQAETHQAADDLTSLLSELADGHDWQGLALAAAAIPRGGINLDAHALAAVNDAGDAVGIDRHVQSLSDIIAQHFESLSSEDGADGPEGRELSPFAARGESAEAADYDQPAPAHTAPQSQAVSQQHETAAEPPDAGSKTEAPGHDAPSPHLGPIVDFSNLPSFQATLNEVQAKLAAIPDLKHGDFAGIVDFSRDLLPEPHAPLAAIPEAGSSKGDGFTMHAPVVEAVHVAINDVIQNMAHDAEAASHHPH